MCVSKHSGPRTKVSLIDFVHCGPRTTMSFVFIAAVVLGLRWQDVYLAVFQRYLTTLAVFEHYLSTLVLGLR